MGYQRTISQNVKSKRRRIDCLCDSRITEMPGQSLSGISRRQRGTNREGGKEMKQINIYDKGDKVYIEYEVDSLIFKNGQLYYKLKECQYGTYLDNAYTAEELIPVPEKGDKDELVGIEGIRRLENLAAGRKAE